MTKSNKQYCIKTSKEQRRRPSRERRTGLLDKSNPHKSGYKFPSWAGIIIRWSLICVIIAMMFGRVSALRSAREEARDLESERAKWERTRIEVQNEIEKFSDPEWSKSYWKSRTMQHEPGEYYIKFYEETSN